MLVKHIFNQKEVAGNVNGNPSFLLTNRNQGFALFGANNNDSRYNGVHFSDKNSFFKVIDSIRLSNSDVTELRNNLYNIERVSGDSVEQFYTNHRNTLLYSVANFNGFIELILDCREIYDFHDKGRMYNITHQDDTIIIEYIKYKDESFNEENYRIYLAIKGVKEYLKPDEWLPVYYPFDHKRGSTPYDLYVYKALQIKVDDSIKLEFAYAENKPAAIELVNYSQENRAYLEKSKRNYLNTLAKNTKPMEQDVEAAYLTSLNAMDSFIVTIDKVPAILAGYPWFMQVWTRDEAICLGALIKQERFEEVRQILMRHVGKLMLDGRVANRFPESLLGSADGVGWVWSRMHDLLSALISRKILKDYFTDSDLSQFKQKLAQSITRLKEYHSRDGLAYNEALETWMDTGYKDDVRDGFRIEIQALRLRMYKLMIMLCDLTGDTVKHQAYSELLKLTRQRVRDVFWHKPALYDGKQDSTIRPNIFLAYYIYPEFLSPREWSACFKHALKSLWLSWGGIASIDINHKYFIDEYTGQNNRSYHRGDSWYFINNLAALCLHRLDAKTFARYIEQILHASVREILYSGVIGYQAELSSAKELGSQASIAQAWSTATFIELVGELS